ncbi:hypothetical protein V7114_06665 [Neobacillus niacini]|uniref:hypothetical protein n=1 Tax=Neobacillus niacini TaxID=86668 RepID=UPI003000F4FD
MATLLERLVVRFRNVPGATAVEVADWIAEAEAESGLSEGEVVSENNALLYLAFSIGCKTIATDAARFFKYTDGEEQVDKTNIFENYMRLSLEALQQFRYHRNGGGSRTVTPKRADAR